MGKITASWPLIVLEVAGGELTLRMRPALIARAFGARPVHAAVNDDAMAFPARGWFRSRYIGIKAGDREGYFGSSSPEELLGILEAAGFNVTWAEQKITYP